MVTITPAEVAGAVLVAMALLSCDVLLNNYLNKKRRK
jgi:hypothetical protein